MKGIYKLRPGNPVKDPDSCFLDVCPPESYSWLSLADVCMQQRQKGPSREHQLENLALWVCQRAVLSLFGYPSLHPQFVNKSPDIIAYFKPQICSCTSAGLKICSCWTWGSSPSTGIFIHASQPLRLHATFIRYPHLAVCPSPQEGSSE